MKKFICGFLSVLIFLVTLTNIGNLSISADNSTDFSVAAKAAIAVDASSGKILYSQNAKESDMGIASITKLLTVYLTYQAVAEHKLSWNTPVTISDYSYNITQNLDASNVTMTKGASYTVKDLVDAALVPSANSAAIALAEKISGTEPKFVDKMRAQLKSWGISDATIVNASGLNNSDLEGNIYPGSGSNAENMMSAEDVAVIATHLLHDFPDVLQITKQSSIVFDKGGQNQQTMNSTDAMLAGGANARTGVDGLKTGNTTYAGNCFVGTTSQNGFRIITVVLDTDDNSDDSARFTTTNSLMNEIYGNWQAYGIASKGESVPGHTNIAIKNAKEKTTKLVAKNDFSVVIPVGTQPDYQLTVSKADNNLQAPISADSSILTAQATIKDKLGYLPSFNGVSATLVASVPVDRANPFVLLWDNFVSFVNEKL